MYSQVAGFSDAHVAADIFKDTAYGQGGIQVCMHQDFTDHGRGSRLAVSAADSHRHVIMLHNLPHKLPSGQTGEIFLMGGNVFRIVRQDGAGIHKTVNVTVQIFGALPVEYTDAL